MNIKGIGSPNVISLYNKNAIKKVDKTGEIQSKDRIEISDLAKTLSEYDTPNVGLDNSAKIQELRNKIQNGTYNVDARLTAESIMKTIDEGR